MFDFGGNNIIYMLFVLFLFLEITLIFFNNIYY